MTRKHFELIAAALASERPAPDSDAALVWEHVRNAIIDALATTNPHFDRDRFFKACEQ